LAAVLQAAGEHLLERRRRAAQAQQRRRADLRRLEDHQVGAVPVRRDRLAQLAKRRLHALLDAAVCRPVGRANASRAACRDQVVRRQEALLLVRKLLVERTPRDASQADHLLDARAVIAARRDSFNHRPMHACALVAHHLIRSKPVRAVGQALIQGSYCRLRGHRSLPLRP